MVLEHCHQYGNVNVQYTYWDSTTVYSVMYMSEQEQEWSVMVAEDLTLGFEIWQNCLV